MADADSGPDKASLAELLTRRTTLYLSSNSEGVELRGNQLKLNETTSLSLNQIRRLVLIGRANVQSLLLYQLLKAGICIDWLDKSGRPFGLAAPVSRDADFCVTSQAAFCASPAAFLLAKQIILAKVDNSREILRRRADCATLREIRKKIADSDCAESLRGYEGAAARSYFSEWKNLLKEFPWRGRRPHPATDPVNIMLSGGYGLLRNRLEGALRSAGLNPRPGFFHVGRGRHMALASDLMEPLRALVDACVLSLVRHNEIRPEAFRVVCGRCVWADRQAFVLLMSNFEAMFAKQRKFYIDPDDNHVLVERSPNDLLDDLAESFALHVHDGAGCIIPRLAPCIPG